MNAVAAVVVAIAHHLRRDRSSVVYFLLLPIGLMVVLGNVYVAEDDAAPVLAVAASDGTRAATVVRVLDATAAVDVRRVDAVDELDDLVRRREVDAGVVVDGDGAVELVGAPDVALPGGVRFVVDGLLARIDVAEALVANGDASDVDEGLAQLPPPSDVPFDQRGEGRAEAAVGVVVLVVFTNLLGLASVIPSHRSLGVLARSATAPVGRSAMVAGYAAALLVSAVFQLVVMLTSGRVLLGISWGPTLPLVVLLGGLAVASAGAGALAGTLLPSADSGSTIGGPIGFALGMLGGCFWPLEIVGDPLASIGRWIPLSWAVDVWRDLAAARVDWSAIGASSFGLVGVGLVLGAVGSVRLRLDR